ncbi:MAG: ATP-dependent helicase, partial [Duncaniella sp.]|nr:ATP-dependent helicase [Duncaniella sp.]
YVHRIGRTARAGAGGSAVTLVSESEQRSFGALEQFLGYEVVKRDIPSEIGETPAYNPARRGGAGRNGRGRNSSRGSNRSSGHSRRNDGKRPKQAQKPETKPASNAPDSTAAKPNNKRRYYHHKRRGNAGGSATEGSQGA